MSKPTIEGPIGPRTRIAGRDLTYFCGTSYYCLHSHPEVIQAAIDAVQLWGMGAATSRTGPGDISPIAELERTAAIFFGTETAVCLTSGFLSNCVGLAALADKYEMIFIDEGAHYSNHLAASAMNRPSFVYNHNDYNHLETLLKTKLKPKACPLIVTDGLFSSMGTIPDLPTLATLAENFDGQVWLDEAHSFGILGPRGRGLADHFGMTSSRIHSGGTLSKAFGSFGGIIPCTHAMRERIESQGAYRGASPPNAASLAAASCGLKLLSANLGWRDKLWSNALELKKGLTALGVTIEQTPVPIAAWQSGNEAQMQLLRDQLFEQGFAIQFIPSGGYSDAPSTGTLRAVVFSEHQRAHLKELCSAIAACQSQYCS